MKPKQTERNGTKTSALPDERTRAMEALLSVSTNTEAAKVAGIGRTTLWRWMQDPAFAAELKAARDAAFAEGLARLKGDVDSAVGKLRGLLDAEEESIQLNAAKAILDHAFKAVGAIETDERLRRIEEQLASVRGANGNGSNT